jgi:2-polyprenyl-3-methyl-5-hydroxy-6-metoxy-1,4-benzoquinol methylase
MVAQVRAQTQASLGLNNSRCYDRLRYINCAVEELTNVEENWNYFDGVIMSEVVEHVNNLEEFMKNSLKLLKVSNFNRMFRFRYREH